jgi:Holliday junction resolvasome RuvABC endonuclease subunit
MAKRPAKSAAIHRPASPLITVDPGSVSCACLGLDLSIKETGFAIIGPLHRIAGVRTFLPLRHSYPAIWWEVWCWLDALIDQYAPGLIVIEKPLFRGPASDCLMGMSAHARSAAWKRGVRVVEIAPSTLKKQITGNGRAEKADVIAAVKALGWQPASDNDADAIALATIGRKLMEQPQ